jgi:hypothetical protein
MAHRRAGRDEKSGNPPGRPSARRRAACRRVGLSGRSGPCEEPHLSAGPPRRPTVRRCLSRDRPGPQIVCVNKAALRTTGVSLTRTIAVTVLRQIERGRYASPNASDTTGCIAVRTSSSTRPGISDEDLRSALEANFAIHDLGSVAYAVSRPTDWLEGFLAIIRGLLKLLERKPTGRGFRTLSTVS